MTVTEYINQYDGELHERLLLLRELILGCDNRITEKIAWGMPTFQLYGNLIHFAVAKNHIGVYPSPSAIEHFANQLTHLKTSKGAIQFPHKTPLPYDLIREIVLFRIEEQVKKTANA